MSASRRTRPDKSKNYRSLAISLSAIIILTVIALLVLPGYGEDVDLGFDLKILPLLNAIFNSISFVFLILALAAIRRKQVDTHRRFILAAVVMTTLFFISYVMYHFLVPSTPYGGDGILRYIYYFVLLTHIPLAALVVPLGLFALFTGLNLEVRRHRRIARWAMPLWLYVSITGVLVYILISPYY